MRSHLAMSGRSSVLVLLSAAHLACGCQSAAPSSGSTAASAAPAAGAAPALTVEAAASASAKSPTAGVTGAPVPAEKAAKVLSPKGQAPHNGPTGTLRGHVRMKGDPPPDTALKFPLGKCGEAAATYGRLFRLGQGGALADALVSVVNYDSYVPEREEAVKLTLRGCALSRRTIAVTYGQRLEVSNLDPTESHMPYLDGSVYSAVMVAVPKGDAVKLYPQEPGHYLIRDQLPNPFLTADVFVLKFATHAVTDLDGEYEIKGIPVGRVLTAAYLPATNQDVKKQVEIKPGDNTLDFELTFDLAAWKEKTTPKMEPAKGAAPKP